MSRGIGARQMLLLRTFVELEAEHGEAMVFPTNMIVDRTYALAHDLQQRVQDDAKGRADGWAALKQEAAAGSTDAKMLLMLGDSIRAFGKLIHYPDHRSNSRSAGASAVEEAINPSRVLASLRRRSLVRRHGNDGWQLLPSGRDKCQSKLGQIP